MRIVRTDLNQASLGALRKIETVPSLGTKAIRQNKNALLLFLGMIAVVESHVIGSWLHLQGPR